MFANRFVSDCFHFTVGKASISWHKIAIEAIQYKYNFELVSKNLSQDVTKQIRMISIFPLKFFIFIKSYKIKCVKLKW